MRIYFGSPTARVGFGVPETGRVVGGIVSCGKGSSVMLPVGIAGAATKLP